MKRRDLLRHLAQHGCAFVREGGNHTVFINPTARKASTIPRHNDINQDLARKICKTCRYPGQKSNAVSARAPSWRPATGAAPAA